MAELQTPPGPVARFFTVPINNISRQPGLYSAAQTILACCVCCLMAACTVVGPREISSGRLAYNEAISATDNQQMLMVLIHNRYGERGHLLTVASVTANVSVTTSAGVQAGFGNTSNYRGNLVPFTGGVIYEENPTISYVPVSGERYLQQLTMPISITLLTQISRSLTDPAMALTTLVSAVNGIYNPDFYFSPDDEDKRFERFVDLVSKLTLAHRLNWVQSADDEKQFSVVIDQSKEKHAVLTRELLALIGLNPGDYAGPRVVIPVSLSLNGAQTGTMGVTTRSVWDLVEILSARIAVPALDENNGVVAPSPPPGRLGQKVHVSYSETEPEHAYIAVEFREGWFYIDERDLLTKEYFKLLGSLWSLTMANASKHSAAAPLLTVPVSN